MYFTMLWAKYSCSRDLLCVIEIGKKGMFYFVITRHIENSRPLLETVLVLDWACIGSIHLEHGVANEEGLFGV
jgi:hypothetical protein